jgi:hypothetical protein
LGSELKRYVSFYFTNFPPLISYFNLRKGFEVCGILEDIYVANKRNIHGEVYGFVKFSNVKDVNKLLKALNVVCFGNYRVQARVGRFDRNDTGDENKLRKETGDTPSADAEVVVTSPVKEGDDTTEGVRVGEVMVKLRGRRGRTDMWEMLRRIQIRLLTNLRSLLRRRKCRKVVLLCVHIDPRRRTCNGLRRGWWLQLVTGKRFQLFITE